MTVRDQLHRERGRLERKRPRSREMALVVNGRWQPRRDVYLAARQSAVAGGPRRAGFSIGALSANVPPSELPPHRDKARQVRGRRRVLADWIASPQSAHRRVMVNRVWQYHFGRGMVRSSSNFGYMGTPPTHPELLDWLATEFVARRLEAQAAPPPDCSRRTPFG